MVFRPRLSAGLPLLLLIIGLLYAAPLQMSRSVNITTLNQGIANVRFGSTAVCQYLTPGAGLNSRHSQMMRKCGLGNDVRSVFGRLMILETIHQGMEASIFVK